MFCDVDRAPAQFKQLDMLLAGAQDDANRRLFIGILLMPGEPAQGKFRLVLVFDLDSAKFQLDCDRSVYVEHRRWQI